MNRRFVLSMPVLFTLIVFAVGSILTAQGLELPKLSQKAVITQSVGLMDITITYHRPGVKGRVVWGGLVPWDTVWRTGANNATTINFTKDVMIEGNKLPAGTYGLFTIPGKEEWTFIFSKQANIWGSFAYKEDQDVLRVKVKPVTGPDCEWMQFYFTDLSADSAKVVLQWEKIMVGFVVKADTKGMILANIDRTMDRYWVTPYSAAEYAFDNGMPDKAKTLIDLSVSLKANHWNMLLKAKIYKQLAKTKIEIGEAIKILEKANLLIKDLPQDDQQYATEGPKLLEEWKAKK